MVFKSKCSFDSPVQRCYNGKSASREKKTLSEYFEKGKDAYGPRWEAYKKAHPLRACICAECGTKKQLQRHHKISVIKWPDGVDVGSNIIVLCKPCHQKEHKHKF